MPVLLDPLLVWHVHHKRSRWYIQNEVVSGAYGSGNKFGIERIRRFKAGRAWGTRRFKGVEVLGPQKDSLNPQGE